MADEIQNFGVYIQPTLPLHITDEVSFLEMLLKFQSKLNEVIYALNNFETDTNNYTDAEIEKLKNMLMSQITYLKGEITKLSNRIDGITYDWDIKLKQAFDRVLDVLYLSQELQNTDWAIEFELLRKEIISMLVYGFPVIDPTTGNTTTVQIALNNIYNAFMNQYGINVEEYESINLTVDEYENYYISVHDYTYTAKEVLFSRWFSPYFNPFTGQRASLQIIINTLASFHIENLTVNAYDALDITVDDYESRDISVENYTQFVG